MSALPCPALPCPALPLALAHRCCALPCPSYPTLLWPAPLSPLPCLFLALVTVPGSAFEHAVQITPSQFPLLMNMVPPFGALQQTETISTSFVGTSSARLLSQDKQEWQWRTSPVMLSWCYCGIMSVDS